MEKKILLLMLPLLLFTHCVNAYYGNDNYKAISFCAFELAFIVVSVALFKINYNTAGSLFGIGSLSLGLFTASIASNIQSKWERRAIMGIGLAPMLMVAAGLSVLIYRNRRT